MWGSGTNPRELKRVHMPQDEHLEYASNFKEDSWSGAYKLGRERRNCL